MFRKLKNLMISRTIRVSLAGIIASVAGMVGITMTAGDATAWIEMAPLAVTTVTSLLAIAGRVFASGPIALVSLPAVIGPLLRAMNGVLKQREVSVE